jgi:hypothetical protein
MRFWKSVGKLFVLAIVPCLIVRGLVNCLAPKR